MKKIMIVIAAACALSACETPRPSPEETAAIDYGPPPQHWQEEIRSYLGLRLIDPKSAIVDFRNEPKKMYQRGIALDPAQAGWAVCVWVNDKNREGAFDGFRPMTFFVRNEKIVAANNDPDHAGPVYAEYARQQCAELGAPFKQ